MVRPIIVILAAIVLMVSFKVVACPYLSFVSPTPSNNSLVNADNTEVRISINESNLDEFRFSWDSTNYTFLANAGNHSSIWIGNGSRSESGLVLALCFNNMSAVGENYNATNASYIHDYSGLGNSGVWTTGATNDYGLYNETGGKYGGAIVFDGEDDYVNISYDSSLYPESITLEGWIKTSTTGVWQGIINNRVDAGSTGYRFVVTTGNKAAISIEASGGATTVVGTTTVTDDNWHHAVATYDSSSGYAAIYVDGINEGAGSTSGTINSDTLNLIIGTLYGPSAEPKLTSFNGTIDEVRIYNRSLSAEEIRLSYGSSIVQLNTTHWEFYSNITGITDGSHHYYG